MPTRMRKERRLLLRKLRQRTAKQEASRCPSETTWKRILNLSRSQKSHQKMKRLQLPKPLQLKGRKRHWTDERKRMKQLWPLDQRITCVLLSAVFLAMSIPERPSC